MTTKIIKQVNLNKEIDRCSNKNGVMTKIPVFSSIRYINGELVGEIEGYKDIYGNTVISNENKTILH